MTGATWEPTVEECVYWLAVARLDMSGYLFVLLLDAQRWMVTRNCDGLRTVARAAIGSARWARCERDGDQEEAWWRRIEAQALVVRWLCRAAIRAIERERMR